MKYLLVILFLYSTSALAHKGRTASDGCHYCRTNCASYGHKSGYRHSHGGAKCDPSKGSPENAEVKSSKTKKSQKRSYKKKPRTGYDIYSYKTKAVTRALIPFYKGAKAKTLYCQCSFDQNKNVSHKACGLNYHKKIDRSYKVEWEHMVPQSRLKTTGAKAPLGDLHNLAPAVGTVNMKRSNMKFGMIPNEAREYGRCDFETSRGVAEPPPHARGDLARAYLYISSKYGMKLSKGELKMFSDWNKLDPPTKIECEKNEYIKKIQGSENLFISKMCL
jgi:deoxyribonuclease-1